LIHEYDDMAAHAKEHFNGPRKYRKKVHFHSFPLTEELYEADFTEDGSSVGDPDMVLSAYVAKDGEDEPDLARDERKHKSPIPDPVRMGTDSSIDDWLGRGGVPKLALTL
jgi:hypothetical protein